MIAGNDVFCALLDGAASMDRHFLNTPLEKSSSYYGAFKDMAS